MAQRSLDTPTGWYPGARRVTVPNFTRYRAGQKAVASTQHVTAGDKDHEFENCITWFENPASEASAHFLIGTDGAIVQFVSIVDTAWANGLQYATAPKQGLVWSGTGWYNARGHKCFPTWPLIRIPINPNLTTISMEHAGQANEPWTEAMFDATVDVLRWVGKTAGIIWTPHRTLIGHYELDTADKRNCPGPHVEWGRLATAANQGTTPRPLTSRYRLKTDQAVFTERRPDAPLASGPDDGMTIRRKAQEIVVGDITSGWAWDATGIGFCRWLCWRGRYERVLDAAHTEDCTEDRAYAASREAPHEHMGPPALSGVATNDVRRRAAHD